MFPIRKEKFNKKQFPIGIILLIFLLNLYFGEKMNIYAASIPFEGEGIAFDSEGNLWMVTHDKAAVTGVRYTTLGWTIKRYNSPIAGNQSVRVKLETYCPDKVDPNNPEYLYGYFVIHKERIFQSINSAYPEWAQELYSKGGTVYLDGIMTVTQNGVKQGSMSENGNLSGEVYTTYSGIAGARNWRDKEGLKSHFDKSVYFPANPGMIETPVEGDENVEVVTVTSGIHAGNLSTVNRLWISSDEFDVNHAIPSSEKVSVSGSLQKYYYQATYEHHYGTKAIPVTVNVTYSLTWNDGLPHQEQVTVTKTVEVLREYSYWKIRDIHLCYLKNAEVQNGALPGGIVRLENLYYPSVTVQKREDSMTLPEAAVSVDGGTIAGGTRKPAVPDSDIFPLVDGKIGKIMVKNDAFCVDGEVWMNGTTCEEKTPAPVTLSGERKQSVQKSNIQIPAVTANQVYESTGVAEYASYFSGGIENTAPVPDINPVAVHTPAVCVGMSGDDIGFNQQIVPTRYKSLILGRTFTVSVGTAGTHLAEKGYGTKDYRKYVKARQVKFPFPVILNGRQIEADQWITLKSETVDFLLPVSVLEGDYDITYRSISINAENNTTEQNYANTDKNNYIATGSVRVTVIGRLYDFCVTNVIDYPRWERVFWKEGKTARTDTVYFSGTNNLNGVAQREQDSLYLVPLLKGSHPYDSTIHAPGLGYRMAYSIKTIGSMWHESDSVELVPTYYYMEQDGSNMQQVKLYQKEDLTEWFLPVSLTAKDRVITADGMQTWNGSYQIPADVYIVKASVNLADYVTQNKGRTRQKDPVFLRNGYLIVYFSIQTIKEGNPHLDYENTQNINRGYCDMWKTEGYQTRRVDSDGTVFQLREGMVFVFDQKKNMHTDYTSVGTH